MNILPKKKWNVYNTKNKEKVQTDEREHQSKLLNERLRHEQIESENRYKQLKEDFKKKRKLEECDEYNSSDSDSNSGNQNTTPPSEKSISSLFEGIEDKIISHGSNNISNINNNGSKGIDLNKISNSKLGQGSYEYKKEKPFWETDSVSGSGSNIKDYKDMNRKEKKKFKNEQWFKNKEDPIHLVDKALGRESKSNKNNNNNNNNISNNNNNKSTSTSSSSSSPSPSSSTKKTIEQLRKERLEREQNERKKETQLLKSINKDNNNNNSNNNNNNNNNNNSNSEYSYIKYSGGILKKKINK